MSCTRLYLSQAQLKTLNGGALPAWNAVYGQTDCPTDAARASLSSAILACNYVSSVSFIEDTTQMFDGLIGCLNYVVMLVIVCAAALAAVVLYNLISVNLGERKKELATIKVLGFYDKEVYRYIFREIDLPSLIGSLVGLVVGIPLHQFIIRTVEMDQMMFIRSIAPRSFVFSVALTMLLQLCRLPAHAPPCPPDQHGGKHESAGIIPLQTEQRPPGVVLLVPPGGRIVFAFYSRGLSRPDKRCGRAHWSAALHRCHP